MDCPANAEITDYVRALGEKCRDLQSIWLIGSRAYPDVAQTSDWDLLAFGNSNALECLRQSADLHRHDVDCLVVTNGNDFENAWGDRPKTGSLSLWEWQEKSDVQAEYTAAKPAPGANWGGVSLRRHLAVRLWSRAPAAL